MSILPLSISIVTPVALKSPLASNVPSIIKSSGAPKVNVLAPSTSISDPTFIVNTLKSAAPVISSLEGPFVVTLPLADKFPATFNVTPSRI